MSKKAVNPELTQGLLPAPGQVSMTREEHSELVSPAYMCLRQAGLLVTDFQIGSAAEIDMWRSNADSMAVGVGCCSCCVSGCFLCTKVNQGSIGLMEDGRGNYNFLGPGVHCYPDCLYKRSGTARLTDSNIVHGDRAIITVPRGYVGVAVNAGRPIVLPPGLHSWKNPTMAFQRLVDLNQPVIAIDPYTLVTVDDGYSAITTDNGKMQVLAGGRTYLLGHRNHLFKVFISEKIETNQLPNILCSTADNVVMTVDATVNWRIVNSSLAGLFAADTMNKAPGTQFDARELRNDVLKQAEASLSAFIAMVNYSDTFGVSASVKKKQASAPIASGSVPLGTDVSGSNKHDGACVPEASPLFDLEKLNSLLDHANEVTARYGVEIFSINIISAFPRDKGLMQSLAKGAVSAAEAQQAKMVARAVQIEAEGRAAASLTLARADAEADRIRAAGSKDAADKLSSSEIAVTLAKIDRTAAALGSSSTVFFGANPGDLGALMANPNVFGNKKDGK